MAEVDNTNQKDSPAESGSWVVAGMAGFFILCIGLGAIYIELSDRLNADQAYRTMELKGQRDALKRECEENFTQLSVLQEYFRQHKELKPPLEAMVSKPCRQLTPVEKPQE